MILNYSTFQIFDSSTILTPILSIENIQKRKRTKGILFFFNKNHVKYI